MRNKNYIIECAYNIKMVFIGFLIIFFAARTYAFAQDCTENSKIPMPYDDISINRSKGAVYTKDDGQKIIVDPGSYEIIITNNDLQSSAILDYVNKHRKCMLDILENKTIISSGTVANLLPIYYLGNKPRQTMIVIRDDILQSKMLDSDLKAGKFEIYLQAK